MPFSLSHKENVYVKRLQGAVQIRTETFVVRRGGAAAQEGDDPWYDKFYEFEAYPLEMFPDAFHQLSFFACLTDALRDSQIQSSNTLRRTDCCFLAGQRRVSCTHKYV
jgi:Gly-Xaa carboxypeptidase